MPFELRHDGRLVRAYRQNLTRLRLKSAMARGTVPVPGQRHPYPILVGIVQEEQTPARADSDNTTPKERK